MDIASAMLKIFCWLIVGAIAGALIVWGMEPAAETPRHVTEASVVKVSEIPETSGRVKNDLESSGSARTDDYAELARRIAALEEEVDRISNALELNEEPGAGSPDTAFGSLNNRSQETPRSLAGVDVGPEGFVVYEVTGTTAGQVWGTDVYTDDSSIAAAAVHSGILQPDETGTVMVVVLSGRARYVGSSRNGVESENYGAWSRSYSLQRLQ